MPRDVARASLYTGTINLWVEDEITRSYLRQLWSDSNIKFLIGGGYEGVIAVVHEAEKAGYHNVFAVIDRDLSQSNSRNWLKSNKKFKRFVLPVHEVENYLLDKTALAASVFNNRGLSAEEIDRRMLLCAKQQIWWMACCAVVAVLRDRFRANFLNDPSQPKINREEAAVQHILKHDWFRTLAHKTAISTEEDIRSLLSEKHKYYSVEAEGRFALSGSSGNCPDSWHGGDSGLTTRPMPSPPSPHKRMTMLVPIGRRCCDRLDDLLPRLKPTPFQSQ